MMHSKVRNRLLSKPNILFECKAREQAEAQFTLGLNEHWKCERNTPVRQKMKVLKEV